MPLGGHGDEWNEVAGAGKNPAIRRSLLSAKWVSHWQCRPNSTGIQAVSQGQRAVILDHPRKAVINDRLTRSWWRSQSDNTFLKTGPLAHKTRHDSMDSELIDRSQSIQNRITQLRDSL